MPKFTIEEQYEIVEEYLDTPGTWTMTKIAKHWNCSQATIGNIIDKVFKDLNNRGDGND